MKKTKRQAIMDKFRKPKPKKLPRKKMEDGTIDVKPMLYTNPFSFYETCGGFLSLYSKDGQYMVSPYGTPSCEQRNLFVLMNDTGRVEFHQYQLFDAALLMLEAAVSRGPFRYEDFDQYKKGSKALIEGKPRPALFKDNWVRPFDATIQCPLKPQEELMKTYFEDFNKSGRKSDMKTFQQEYKKQETSL